MASLVSLTLEALRNDLNFLASKAQDVPRAPQFLSAAKC